MIPPPTQPPPATRQPTSVRTGTSGLALHSGCACPHIAEVMQKLDEILEVVKRHHKEHFTVEEVAREVGRSAYTVRRWIKSHLIRHTRVPGTRRLLIPRDELHRLLREGPGDGAPAMP